MFRAGSAAFLSIRLSLPWVRVLMDVPGGEGLFSSVRAVLIECLQCARAGLGSGNGKADQRSPGRSRARGRERGDGQ